MDDLKNLILDHAQSRFDRFGFQKTTMDEISRDCKISKRTLYEHFRDKQHLFDSLFVRECQKDLEIIFDRMGEVPDPLDRLLKLLRNRLLVGAHRGKVFLRDAGHLKAGDIVPVEIEDADDYDLYGDALVIHTTIDSRLQDFANQAVARPPAHGLDALGLGRTRAPGRLFVLLLAARPGKLEKCHGMRNARRKA